MLEGTWLTVQGWRCPTWAGPVSGDREEWLIADNVFLCSFLTVQLAWMAKGKCLQTSVLSSAVCQEFTLRLGDVFAGPLSVQLQLS